MQGCELSVCLSIEIFVYLVHFWGISCNVTLQHQSEKQLAAKLMHVQRGYLINNVFSTQSTDCVNMIQCSEENVPFRYIDGAQTDGNKPPFMQANVSRRLARVLATVIS